MNREIGNLNGIPTVHYISLLPTQGEFLRLPASKSQSQSTPTPLSRSIPPRDFTIHADVSFRRHKEHSMRTRRCVSALALEAQQSLPGGTTDQPRPEEVPKWKSGPPLPFIVGCAQFVGQVAGQDRFRAQHPGGPGGRQPLTLEIENWRVQKWVHQ
jgi:hypothetical protein